MRLCELTMSERESLDKINTINLELEKSGAKTKQPEIHCKCSLGLFT